MFMNPRRFIGLFSGAFFAPLVRAAMPEVVPSANSRRGGKGKGKSTPPVRNAAAQKRAAKKAKGRAVNKARHAG